MRNGKAIFVTVKNPSGFGLLREFLRHGKRGRKRGKIKDSRGIISNRVSIEKQPSIVSKRQGLGDFEVDLMMGSNHKGTLLVLTNRASLHTRLAKIDSKDSGVVLTAMKSILRRNKHRYGHLLSIMTRPLAVINLLPNIPELKHTLPGHTQVKIMRRLKIGLVLFADSFQRKLIFPLLQMNMSVRLKTK